MIITCYFCFNNWRQQKDRRELIVSFGKFNIFSGKCFPHIQCVKNIRIRSFSGPHFSAFRLNMERYVVSLRIQSEGGKIRTRKTPNTNFFSRSDRYYMVDLQYTSVDWFLYSGILDLNGLNFFLSDFWDMDINKV